jgi:hypothetical protein
MLLTPSHRLRRREKVLLACSLLPLAALILANQRRDRTVPDMATPGTSYQTLLETLSENDASALQRLTTARGMTALQQAINNPNIGSYPALAFRLEQEYGHKVFWPSTSPPGDSWGIRKRRTKFDGNIFFRRTARGWQLDDFQPNSDVLPPGIKRRAFLVYTDRGQP